jgi:hypothetical protein
MSSREETASETRFNVEDSMKMDLKEIECEDVDWIHLAQDRFQWRTLVNMGMNLRVP